jgi:hypothetical protein
MNQELIALCEQKFAAQVDALFKQQLRVNTATMSVPVIEFSYPADDQELVPQLKRAVVNALVWRERFDQTKPPWAPQLPVTLDGCMRLQASGSKRMKQMGNFSRSLLTSLWDSQHPDLENYVHGREKVWGGDATIEKWERLFARMHPEFWESVYL